MLANLAMTVLDVNLKSPERKQRKMHEHEVIQVNLGKACWKESKSKLRVSRRRLARHVCMKEPNLIYMIHQSIVAFNCLLKVRLICMMSAGLL